MMIDDWRFMALRPVVYLFLTELRGVQNVEKQDLPP